MIEKLVEKFADTKFNDGPQYSVGRGSLDWVDLKSDYLLEDMAIAGSISYWKNNSLSKVDLYKSNEDLKLFKTRVLNYEPKDDIEKGERELVLEQIEIGLKIFEELMKTKEQEKSTSIIQRFKKLWKK